MIGYTVGLAFNQAASKAVLIEKARPSWQAGSLNGPGGKIDAAVNETPIDAMVRKFKQETGLPSLCQNWELSIVLESAHFEWPASTPAWRVYFFRSFSLEIERCKTQTDEAVAILDVDGLPIDKLISPLQWAIPFCIKPGTRTPLFTYNEEWESDHWTPNRDGHKKNDK